MLGTLAPIPLASSNLPLPSFSSSIPPQLSTSQPPNFPPSPLLSSYATSHDATTITGADSLGGASTVDSNGVRIKRTGKLDRVLAVIIGVPCASFEHSRRWAAFYQVLEYIQVFLYLILPLWNWNIDPEGNV